MKALEHYEVADIKRAASSFPIDVRLLFLQKDCWRFQPFFSSGLSIISARLTTEQHMACLQEMLRVNICRQSFGLPQNIQTFLDQSSLSSKCLKALRRSRAYTTIWGRLSTWMKTPWSISNIFRPQRVLAKSVRSNEFVAKATPTIRRRSRN